MSRPKRHRKGGRTTPKGTRPMGWERPQPVEEEPPLLADIRAAARDPHPLGLLAFASTMLEVLTPDRVASFGDEGEERVDREEALASFLDVRVPEITLLLAGIAALTTDDILRARIGRELTQRRHPVPAWLERLGEAEIHSPQVMEHVLGDGDDIVFGIRLPGGAELAVMVYVDHNVGTTVKDAFVSPQPVTELVATMKEVHGDDPDTTWSALDLADARARIEGPLEHGRITVPPFETDTWPSCRPIVEWALSLMPDGGTGYVWNEPAPGALEAQRDGFLDSPYAEGVPVEDAFALTENLLWFAAGHGTGDPLRWSPVSVELVLLDWIPRKVVADVEHLDAAPAVLRHLIRYAHAERGIRPELTLEMLAAVDRWEAEYRELIRTPRHQGPMALLEAMGAPVGPPEGWDEDDWSLDEHDFDLGEYLLDQVRQAVGEEHLDRIDTDPLPDEPFDLASVPEADRRAVAEIVELVDGACDTFFDVEHRTAAHRLLSEIVAGDLPVLLRGKPTNTAQAVVWLVGKANGTLGSGHRQPGRPLVQDLQAHFGTKAGGSSQRADALLAAAGIERGWAIEMGLGHPRYLTAEQRASLIERRERARQIIRDGSG